MQLKVGFAIMAYLHLIVTKKAFYLQQIFALSLLVAVDLDIWLWYNYSNKTSQNMYGMGWETCTYIGPSDRANTFPFLRWLSLQLFSLCLENTILNTFFSNYLSLPEMPNRKHSFFRESSLIDLVSFSQRPIQFVPFKAGFEIGCGGYGTYIIFGMK